MRWFWGISSVKKSIEYSEKSIETLEERTESRNQVLKNWGRNESSRGRMKAVIMTSLKLKKRKKEMSIFSEFFRKVLFNFILNQKKKT